MLDVDIQKYSRAAPHIGRILQDTGYRCRISWIFFDEHIKAKCSGRMHGRNHAVSRQVPVDMVLDNVNLVRQILAKLPPRDILRTSLTSKTFHEAAVHHDRDMMNAIYENAPGNGPLVSDLKAKSNAVEISRAKQKSNLCTSKDVLSVIAYALLRRMGASGDEENGRKQIGWAVEYLGRLRTHPSFRDFLLREQMERKAAAVVQASKAFHAALDQFTDADSRRIPPESLLLAMELHRSTNSEVRQMLDEAFKPTSFNPLSMLIAATKRVIGFRTIDSRSAESSRRLSVFAKTLLDRMGADAGVKTVLLSRAMECLRKIIASPSFEIILIREAMDGKASVLLQTSRVFRDSLGRYNHRDFANLAEMPPEVLLLAIQLDRSTDWEIRHVADLLERSLKQSASDEYAEKSATAAVAEHRDVLSRLIDASRRRKLRMVGLQAALHRTGNRYANRYPLDPLPPRNALPIFL